MSRRFGSNVRLRSRREFSAVQRRGYRIAMRYLTVLGLPNALGRDRLGVIASRRVGNAVVRNRAKRRLRELFRNQQPDLATERGRPFDIVAIPRAGFLDAAPSVLQADFVTAVARLRAARSI